QSATGATAFSNPLIVTLTDAFNNPVQGTTVTFTAPTLTGASGTFSGSVITIIPSPDANGQVSKPFTADTHSGGYTVTASVSGVSTPASFALTNTPGAANSIVTTSGAPQST